MTHSETPTIWEMQNRVARRLLGLNLANIQIGLRLMRARRPFVRGIGQQNLAWGLINCGIALFGMWGSQRRRASLPDADDPAQMEREARTLWRILAVNTGLDVLYLLLGWKVARAAKDKPARRGTGVGIFLQGALLFAFDLYHTLTVGEQTR